MLLINMKNFPIEALDEYIRLQKITNDHQIRAVLEFDGFLDLQQIKNAVMQSIRQIPILGCGYHDDSDGVFWASKPFSENDVFTIIECHQNNIDLLEYLQNIASEEGPLIKVQLIRQTNHDTLIICLNHMAFDGAGLKTYLYTLSNLYANQDSSIPYEVQKTFPKRQLGDLLKNIPLNNKTAALFRKTFAESDKAILTDTTEAQPHLRILHITEKQFNKLKPLCKRDGITINDYILALFAHAWLQLAPEHFTNDISIQVMFDLRRYVTNFPVSPYGNFSSMESLTINQPQHNLLALARDIHNAMETIKSDYPGLKNVILINLLYRFLPRKTYGSILQSKIQSIGLSTSNLGILDAEKLTFPGVNLENAYLLTSIKNQPASQLSFSTFKNHMTLSILGKYSDRNWQKIEQLCDLMELNITISNS
jgi:NRPS condensation-like uncharacterized protein